MFTQLEPARTGIYFSNDIEEDTGGELLISEFLYLGGGVGIGDFNNDGKKDIFLTGNQVTNRLYINRKDLRFEDVTRKAGLVIDVWSAGVSIVDLNNDGYDDIYVCVYGDENLLFINNGDLTFSEQAEKYGLADGGDSTQGVFFDYDKDGNLDLFLTNYPLEGPNPNILHPRDTSGRSPANDKLYQNQGTKKGEEHPHFVEVTRKVGIKGDGYGLGIVVSDFNNDLWPDIYVANDFLSGDELWLNNRDGTFQNAIGKAFKHQSYSSMGVDATDINNDQLTDIVTLDMSPEYNKRKKLQYTFMDYDRYRRERSFGYEPSFMRNMLQLNNGVRFAQRGKIPFFSEIGQYAGISETGWSWSVLAADFNNDRWKDLYITNGTGRDFLHADYIDYYLSLERENPDEAEKNRLLNERLRSLGSVKLSNYFYRNNRDYTFTNITDSSGLSEPSLSNGAAYADIDNDGDLDLIVNNINEPASVYRNNTIDNTHKSAGSHYLQIELRGPPGNLDAVGGTVLLYSDNKSQKQEKYPVRGYLSSVDSRLFFGLGTADNVDSLLVIWPDHTKRVITNIPADTLLEIEYEEESASEKTACNPPKPAKGTFFDNLTSRTKVHYEHKDVPYNDFRNQPLLPQKYSQLGPYISTGDIDNDGFADFFVGGGFNFPGAVFQQHQDGTFQYRSPDTSITYREDMDSALFDADQDGDLDLLITYGDTRYDETSIYYKPRLYINDGEGNFGLRKNAIPDHVRTIAGTVAVHDYNEDGYPDLFIGGRVSKRYPYPPRSFLLKNEEGSFTDVTTEVSSALERPGMISSAVWTDIDGDQAKDLIIAGEWMPVRFFKNKKDRLQEITDSAGLAQTRGLWRSLEACDIDNDGDMDVIAGNFGNNNKYRVTNNKPLQLFAVDLDENGIVDPIMSYYIKDRSGSRNSYPAVKRDKLLQQVPSLRQVFGDNEAYATATIDDILQYADNEGLLQLGVNETGSSYFENIGDAEFKKHLLPAVAQFAPVNAIICEELDDDGNVDLLIAGNEYQAEVRTGRYDASYGYFLRGTGGHGFEPVSPVESGFIVDGDVKDMALVESEEYGRLVLVAVNDDSLSVFGIP